MIFTSGHKQRKQLTQKIYEFACSKYPELRNTEITVLTRGLKKEGVYGWCTPEDENEWLIELETTLDTHDYITVMFHELVHVKQDLAGFDDVDAREDEAYRLEKVLTMQYNQTESKSFYFPNRLMN